MDEQTREETRRLDLDEVAKKVRWEGGVLAALEYGIGSEEIGDPELATVWRRMEDLYDALRPAMRQAERIMSTVRRAA